MSTKSPNTPGVPSLRLLDQSARALDLAGRTDAAEWIRTLIQREAETTAVVALGEVKRGKSSLLNVLIGHPVLPVDADLATGTFIRVHHDEDVGDATLVLADGTQEQVAIADLPRRVGVTDLDPTLPLAVGADIGVPMTWLPEVDLIDTPGVGGMQSVHTQRALESAARAGVLLFIVDAGQPISAAELAVLRHGLELDARIVVAMTRIDAHPTRWRTVLEETSRLIAQAAGRPLPIHPVSAQFGVEAMRLGVGAGEADDPASGGRPAGGQAVGGQAAGGQAAALWQASGLGGLVEAIRSAAADAAAWPRYAARDTADHGLQQVLTQWRRERAALDGDQDDEQLAVRRANLAELTGHRERWSLDLQRDLARLKQHTAARITRELDAVQHQWSTDPELPARTARDLRNVAVNVESSLHLLADRIIADFHTELLALVQRLFATVDDLDFDLDPYLPQAPETATARLPRRRLPVLDPSMVSMAMLGAGLAPQFGALIGIATGVGLFQPAGLVFGGALVAINVAFRSRRAGQQQVADMVADSTRRTRTDLMAWCDLVVTEVQPEIRVAYADRLQAATEAVERELAAARRSRAENARARRDAAAELDQKIDVCSRLVDRLQNGLDSSGTNQAAPASHS